MAFTMYDFALLIKKIGHERESNPRPINYASSALFYYSIKSSFLTQFSSIRCGKQKTILGECYAIV